MYSQDTVLELLELVYAAAGDPAKWGALLERLGRIIGGTAGSLHNQHSGSQQADVAASWNIDPLLIGQYVSHYSQVNPIFELGKKLIREGAVNPRQSLCPDDVLLRSEFYNDYLLRLDAFHGVAATVLENGIVSANLTIFRAKSADPVGENECKLLRLLMPHLQRAFQLHNRIQGLTTKGDAASDALDQLQQGVVLLEANGRPLLVNRAATTIFASEKAIRLTPNGLVATLSFENRKLRRLINGAIVTGSDPGAESGGAMSISRGPLPRPLQILVIPLRPRAIRLGKDVPLVAVFISDPDRKPVSESRVFSQLYGLTAAESRLATLLAAGKTLKDAAQQLGLAQSTLRSQLKSVFAKTNTSRQSQLVRLMLLTPSRPSSTPFRDGHVLE